MNSTKHTDNLELFCSFCEKDGVQTKIENGLGVSPKCQFCGRNICKKHRVFNYTDYHLGYPNIWCLECYAIGLKYYTEIEILRNVFLIKEKELLDKWKKEADDNAKKSKELA